VHAQPEGRSAVDVGRDAVFAGEVDDGRHEAVVTVTVDRGREANDRGADALVRVGGENALRGNARKMVEVRGEVGVFSGGLTGEGGIEGEDGGSGGDDEGLVGPSASARVVVTCSSSLPFACDGRVAVSC
jgi:hypothetical protein